MNCRAGRARSLAVPSRRGPKAALKAPKVPRKAPEDGGQQRLRCRLSTEDGVCVQPGHKPGTAVLDQDSVTELRGGVPARSAGSWSGPWQSAGGSWRTHSTRRDADRSHQRRRHQCNLLGCMASCAGAGKPALRCALPICAPVPGLRRERVRLCIRFYVPQRLHGRSCGPRHRRTRFVVLAAWRLPSPCSSVAVMYVDRATSRPSITEF